MTAIQNICFKRAERERNVYFQYISKTKKRKKRTKINEIKPQAKTRWHRFFSSYFDVSAQYAMQEVGF